MGQDKFWRQKDFEAYFKILYSVDIGSNKFRNKDELQGSHRVWKTEKIMVWEKSANFILGQKSGIFFYFGPKVWVFFPRMAECQILKISRIYRPHMYIYPGAHGQGKTGKMAKKNPCMGKVREFENFI